MPDRRQAPRRADDTPMPPVFFALYAAEYLSDSRVRSLTPAQRGYLVDLWCYHWRDDALPADVGDCCRMVGVSDPAELEPVLERFFPLDLATGRRQSVRQQREKEAATARYRLKLSNMAKARKAKKDKQKANDRSIHNPIHYPMHRVMNNPINATESESDKLILITDPNGKSGPEVPKDLSGPVALKALPVPVPELSEAEVAERKATLLAQVRQAQSEHPR